MNTYSIQRDAGAPDMLQTSAGVSPPLLDGFRMVSLATDQQYIKPKHSELTCKAHSF